MLVGVALAVLSQIGLFAALLAAVVLILCLAGVGLVLLPESMIVVRWVCAIGRRLATHSGVPVDDPYRPPPDTSRGRVRWILTDPATWRDLAWLVLGVPVGLLMFLPAALLYYVGEGIVLAAGLWQPIHDAGYGRWYGPIHIESHLDAGLAAMTAVLFFVVWTYFAPAMVRAHALFTRSLLGPTKAAALAARARHLSRTRDDVIDSGAAELRRIERDLHDGAQARLVAIGMTLGAAERTLHDDPDVARELLAAARSSSAAALTELRDLVRGIHPPVLAERGLVDAVRALALSSPLPIATVATIEGRLPRPLESAVYFAVSELVANTLKHGDATDATITMTLAFDTLRVRLQDNGCGGASFDTGSGLAGIRRRLSAFDGTMTLDSPPGGPTIIELEVPCASSSPKTTSS
ncbi:Signal transduction histidine kinase [Rhodococcoides kyotonense]|uniref:histidine kinase n=2 Tax=Rhodococcoides kyotonense TaxID=398843 RepID=A0A239EIN6_9NOCA|nr:Signal transduction histidine kinase [Rhodococcus kyotonensis]